MTDNVDRSFLLRSILADRHLWQIPATPNDTGIEGLDEDEALQARVKSLEMLVLLLLEDRLSREPSVEDFVNNESAALFSRLLSLHPDDSLSQEGRSVAEMLSTNMLEQAARAVLREK